MTIMRQLAWDGLVFDVPANWELARYHYPDRARGMLDIEDETARRLEWAWIVTTSDTRRRHFMARAAEGMERLTARADRHDAIAGLAPDWQATQFGFREILPTRKRRKQFGIVCHDMVSAVYAPADQPLRCVLRLNFLPGDPENPEELTRHITHSFQYLADHEIRWRVFDLDFRLDADFALEATQFDIGAKLMRFRKQGRKLFCWTLSCADRIVSSAKNEAAWITGFLNERRQVPGIVFLRAPDGGITWRRRRFPSFVNGDEIARRCFRYTVGSRRDRRKNQWIIWVFNYRRDADLKWIERYPAIPADDDPGVEGKDVRQKAYPC